MKTVSMLAQPDGVTCGPTCLHALYDYFSDPISLEETIATVSYLDNGGTLAVLLGCHALRRGYQATLHSFNLHVLDPTWMIGAMPLMDKLRIQQQRSKDAQVKVMTEAYITFLELGGRIVFGEITERLLSGYFENQLPLLSGVSATYLYKNMRDYTSTDNQVVYDEWLGEPTGHFIVLQGLDPTSHTVSIADPYKPSSFV